MEKILSTSTVFKCPIFRVEESEVELPDGTKAKRWYVVKRDAVLVICVKEEKIIMRREFRSASQSVEWRFPSGGINDGEDPRLAAIRETREEIGLEPLDIKHLLTIKNNSSVIKQDTYCFIATTFKENPLNTGEKEERYAEITELTQDEIKKIMSEGQLSVNMVKALNEYFKM